MPWPSSNIAGDGMLTPFTDAQLAAMKLTGTSAKTADIREGDHPAFELDSRGCSIRRTWMPPWSERDNAIAAILGGVSLRGAFPNWELSRVMPQVFPKDGYSQYVGLAAESVKGAGGAGQNDANAVPSYPSARITIRYEQVFFGLAPDGAVAETNRYVEQLPSSTEASYLSIPGSMMKYRHSLNLFPAGTLIPYNVGRPEVLSRAAYKWHRIPYEAWRPGSPLFDRVHGDPSKRTIVPVTGAPPGLGKVVGVPYIGCVSSAAALGYPSGYALFEGVEEEIVPDPVRGFPCWNLTYKFLIKSAQGGSQSRAENYGGHNYLFFGGGATDSALQGYYFARKDDSVLGIASNWIANGSIWDGLCLFNERNLLNLWKVGAVADALI